MNNYRIIDLFSGCGGLSAGFKKNNFKILAHLEIDKSCCNTLKENFTDGEIIFNKDICATKTYIKEFKKFGNIDGIIGGPPCQAYSIAGRNNKENKMETDPRNFLFESFVYNLKALKPKFFLFENVTGMLSAKPFNLDICKEIKNAFNECGYSTLDNFKDCVFDMSKYGIPQKRKRIIIFGVSKTFSKSSISLVEKFYDSLRRNTLKKITTVRDAIYDLPKLSDNNPVSEVSEHTLRFRNERDKSIFSILAKDIQDGKNRYTSTEALKELYTKFTGHNSDIHKYYVLRLDEPSNTIPAHIYKDGLRHIHPDPLQARSLSIREVMRLMTFDDDFKLIGSNGDKYKMLGNAVPPKFSSLLSNEIINTLFV
tara:strand:- start:93 stop:1196 length:1104 start_codon:yes stop_codon:yes gene_type:complete